MEKNPTIKIPITKIVNGEGHKTLDNIATEAPLEISISLPQHSPKVYDKSISLTMRTPGADRELAIGFLLTEGILTDMSQISDIHVAENRVNLILSLEEGFDLTQLDRHFYTSSSCGVCGKSSIDAIKTVAKPRKEKNKFHCSQAVLLSLQATLKENQNLFEYTGGIHAAAIFTAEGQLLNVFEDVGRHNALDKLIGHCFLTSLDMSNTILLLSGRISFELVHKAAVAGLPLIAGLGAPSSLAIETAEEYDITLVGFLNDKGFNCYHAAAAIKDWNFKKS